MKKADRSTVIGLLGRFIDTEYKIELLADISQENFEMLYSNITTTFEDLELTRADVKDIWKDWFDWAVYNGTLVDSRLHIVGQKPTSYPVIDIYEMIVGMAIDAIDNLIK